MINGDLVNSYTNVQQGDTMLFSASSIGKTKLGNTFELYIDGRIIELNTSCAEDIQWFSIGPVMINGFIDKFGNACNMLPVNPPPEAITNSTVNELEVQVRPNPFEDYLLVTGALPKLDHTGILQLIDPYGRILYERKLSIRHTKEFEERISTKHFPPSLYFILVKTGSDYQLIKVVKGVNSAYLFEN